MDSNRRLNGAAKAATYWIGSVQSLIVHTILFGMSFALVFLGFALEQILLVVTTVVSLEAIYLAIFIQMAINEQAQSLDEVEKDIDEIQKDVDEIQEDVDEIQEDVAEIEKDETEEEMRERQNMDALNKIEKSLMSLVAEIEQLKKDKR